jgi:peptide/nickel transport system substrate-binding protein
VTARHRRTALLSSLLCAFLLSSCGPAPRKAQLVVGVEAEPASLDPRRGADVAADRAFRILYRSLFTTGQHFEPIPDLVESWEQRSPTEYEFLLKRGVRFSDGREVTAADAAFTLESIRSGAVASFRKGDLDRIASVEARGRYALSIRLSEPFAPFLGNLNLGILPAGTPPETRAPVGCGAYRLKEWVPGQWLLFEANPFSRPPPRCTTVAFKIIPDPVVRALEMRRGSVDLVVNDLPPDSIAYFRREGYRVARAPGANYAYLGLNCARPPLDRREVRRAIAYAVDREAILTSILDGFGRKATGLLCPENWAFNGDVETYPHDPGRATALLDAAGLKPDARGVRLRLAYKTSNSKVSRQIATAIAQQLADVGIQVSIQWLEWGTFYGDIRRGDFDCFALTWVGITDPDGLRLRFSSKAFPPGGFNRGRYSNPEVDALVQEGARELDPAKRREIYARAQALLAEDVPYVSLWYPDNVAVTQRGIGNVLLPPDANFSFIAGVSRRSR